MDLISRLVFIVLFLGVAVSLKSEPVFSAQDVSSSPVESRPVLRSFQYKKNIAGYSFDLDLYVPDESSALHVSQAVFTELKARSLILKEIQRQVQAAKQARVPLDAEALKHMSTLIDFCTRSEGAFDPSDLPLEAVWGFTRGSFDSHYPESKLLERALKKVNCQAVDLNQVPPTLFISQPDLELNWDSWTPAWLLQQGVELLQSPEFKQLPAARLKIGASAYYHGVPPQAVAWKVPLPHPRQKNEIYAYLYLKDQSLIVLGDYQNYFFHNGIRYSNLLHARSGLPARDTVAVYLTSGNAFEAYLMARSVAVLNTAQTTLLRKHFQSGEIIKLLDRNGVLFQEAF